MKEIKAIVQTFMLEHIFDALERIEGLPGLTISEVVGYGKYQKAEAGEVHALAGRSFSKKTKLEVVVTDEMAPLVVDAVARAGRTGNPGDGKLFVLEVAEVVKIRTGDRGAGAI